MKRRFRQSSRDSAKSAQALLEVYAVKGQDKFKKQSRAMIQNMCTPAGGRNSLRYMIYRDNVNAEAGWRPKDLQRERKLWDADRSPDKLSWANHLRARRAEMEAQGVTFLCAAR